MNLIELNRSLRQLRLGGIAAVLETRLQQAQAEPMAPIDFLSCLVSDELTRRGDRLIERRQKQAQFRDPQATLDNFDFDFNKKMNRSLVFDLATATFVSRHYGRASTLVTSNRPVEDWGKLLGDSAAVTAMLDRLLHHGHILKCGPRSWRTKSQAEQNGGKATT